MGDVIGQLPEAYSRHFFWEALTLTPDGLKLFNDRELGASFYRGLCCER